MNNSGTIFPEHNSRFIGQLWKDHVHEGYPANNPEIVWLYDNGEKESHYDVFYVGGILAGDCISIFFCCF